MTPASKKLLIAASGTGGHLFPAIATAEQLPDYQIEWLGVPDRLETQLVPDRYLLHTVNLEGFQKRLGIGTIEIFTKLVKSILYVRQLLQQGQFQGVFTTGGYIAAPAIIAAKTLGLPTILHESNALPGKVTRWLSPLCTTVALGFDAAAQYLPHAYKVSVGTPVRSQFLQDLDRAAALLDLGVPGDVRLIIVVGGSQGAVAVNQIVRQCVLAWIEAGAWVVHLTGESDPDAQQIQHPHYIVRPFYDNMASLLGRADLAISRAGAGTLTELAIAHTPSILIPYPFAAEDHQTYNAAIFAASGAAIVYRQSELTADLLSEKVLGLLRSPRLQEMADAAGALAIADSATQLASLIRTTLDRPSAKTSRDR